MKHFLFATIAFLFCFNLGAQDIKKVRSYYDKKDWVKGKEAVDLLLANEKEQKNWEAWYYKGLIYGQIAKDANLKTTVANAWLISLEAYQKAMELDSKQVNTYMTLRGYPVFDNYLELQREANEFYNKQDFKNAYNKYLEADKAGRFIFKSGWALSEVDTILYFYTGAAAMQSDMMEEAVAVFKKICDANIGGDGYDVCYRYVAYYYDKKGDVETANKYAAAGRKLYPADSYYDKLELDRERKNGVGLELFKRYEAVIAKEPKDYDLRYDYAAEMFNWLYTDQAAPADQKEATFNKILEQLKICTELDNSKPDAHLLTGKTFFNEAAAIQEALKGVKGTAPADVQKKTEMKAKMEGRMKECLTPLETSLAIFEKMPAEELKKEKRLRNEYKTTLYLLTEAYRFLGNPEKEKFYDKKYQVLNQ